MERSSPPANTKMIGYLRLTEMLDQLKFTRNTLEQILECNEELETKLRWEVERLHCQNIHTRTQLGEVNNAIAERQRDLLRSPNQQDTPGVGVLKEEEAKEWSSDGSVEAISRIKLEHSKHKSRRQNGPAQDNVVENEDEPEEEILRSKKRKVDTKTMGDNLGSSSQVRQRGKDGPNAA